MLRTVSDATPATSLPRDDKDSLALGFRIAFAVLSALALAAGYLNEKLTHNPTDEPPAELVFVGLGILATMLVTSVCFLIGLYRSWRLVQPARARNASLQGAPTPGSAVGLLFIPFFHLYWMFRAIGGLPRALSALADTYHLDVRRMNPNYALGNCVFFILCSVTAFIPADAESVGLSMLQGLVGIASMVFTYLNANDMFNVSWDLRHQLKG